MRRENNELGQSFLQHTFNRRIENFDKLELFLSKKCNQECEYCYLNRYGESLYPDEIEGNYVENVRKALKRLPDSFNDIEIFSGEPLIKDYVYEILNLLIETDELHYEKITIPTNGTFIFSDELTDRFEKILEKGREHDRPIFPSFSVDGKYCQGNRPLKSGGGWSEENWNDAFRFAKRWGGGFHPMVYSKEIEKWKDNFLWFQEKMKQFDVPFHNLYLLEVRNAEWSEEQMKELEDFVIFLLKWVNDFFGGEKEKIVDFIFDEGFNILSSPLCNIGRGLGCSLQSTFNLRIGDLAWVPCHRTSYEPFILGYLEDDGVKIENPELMIRIFSFDSDTAPYCEQCPLKELCSKGCLGSQFETTGDLFTPIPSVCKMEFFKTKGLLEGLEKIGIRNKIKNRVSESKRTAIENLEELI